MNNFHSLQNDFIITTNKQDLDVKMIHTYLSEESYWAKNIPLPVVQKSIEGSFCFGIYKKSGKENLHQMQGKKNQCGFARVITDKATFGYIADVFILPPFRKLGLSKWLMSQILAHPELQGFRGWMLGTKDAHTLYTQFGFESMENTKRIMRLSLIEAYPP